jgi:hypothetical protein
MAGFSMAALAGGPARLGCDADGIATRSFNQPALNGGILCFKEIRMIKVQILILCEHCDGDAYVPVGEATSSTGEPYINHIPSVTTKNLGRLSPLCLLEIISSRLTSSLANPGCCARARNWVSSACFRPWPASSRPHLAKLQVFKKYYFLH